MKREEGWEGEAPHIFLPDYGKQHTAKLPQKAFPRITPGDHELIFTRVGGGGGGVHSQAVRKQGTFQ